tara:strand:+ start:629 stop:1282 length:654 start_codon:yes stop_codon:yes gene_type:complete
MTTIIAPSILAADFGNIERDCNIVNSSEADWFHIDIMDGVFVPNISFGMPVLASIQKYAQKPLDVHLMIVDPDRYIETFHKLGAEILTIHYEACNHLHRSIQIIKSFGMKAGVALNPHTPISHLKNIIYDIDLVCLMSVNPGFSGQSFIQNTFAKTTELRKLIKEKDSSCTIEIDGGVTDQNAAQLISSGADILVAGSHVFKSDNPLEKIKILKRIT